MAHDAVKKAIEYANEMCGHTHFDDDFDISEFSDAVIADTMTLINPDYDPNQLNTDRLTVVKEHVMERMVVRDTVCYVTDEEIKYELPKQFQLETTRDTDIDTYLVKDSSDSDSDPESESESESESEGTSEHDYQMPSVDEIESMPAGTVSTGRPQKSSSASVGSISTDSDTDSPGHVTDSDTKITIIHEKTDQCLSPADVIAVKPNSQPVPVHVDNDATDEFPLHENDIYIIVYGGNSFERSLNCVDSIEDEYDKMWFTHWE